MGWMEWMEEGGGRQTQSSCHFQTSLNQQNFPLFRVDKRTRGLLYLPARVRGNGGSRVLKGGCGWGINEGIESNSLILGGIDRCTWGKKGSSRVGEGVRRNADRLYNAGWRGARALPQTHHESTQLGLNRIGSYFLNSISRHLRDSSTSGTMGQWRNAMHRADDEVWAFIITSPGVNRTPHDRDRRPVELSSSFPAGEG